MSDVSSSSFLAVYDISAGLLKPLAVSSPFPNFAEDLALCGQYVCVATLGGLSILDLSDMAAIHEIGRYTYSSPPDAPSGISCLAIDGSIAYLTDADNSLLIVVDLSDPTHPQELARLQMPGFGQNVTFSNGYLYASNGMGGFSIYQTAAAAGQMLGPPDGFRHHDAFAGVFGNLGVEVALAALVEDANEVSRREVA